jgi:DNA replication and repair protein RecF
MHLARLRLRDFRNYARLDAAFQPGFHLFLGNNGQGKTNLLEAIYFLATLRSFRGAGGSQMVRHGQTGYFVGATVLSEVEREIKTYWSAQGRSLHLDDHPVRVLSEYLGVFRAVIFSTDDLQLIKGPSSRRRRFLDLLLTQTHPTYLPLLQRYVQALRSRNALLKQPHLDEAALDSFTRELVATGNGLIESRRTILPQIAPVVSKAYSRISADAEQLQLQYQPSVKGDFAVELAQARLRERSLRSTFLGPHRDELLLSLNGRPADQYGSEGQKRSIGLALKMAQAEYLTKLHGSPPVLLIDDVMGELDALRRRSFLPLLHHATQERSQIFMTATEESWPQELGINLQRWEVAAGHISHLNMRA